MFDLLLSLSALIVVCSFILPMAFQLFYEMKYEKDMNLAVELLYERLHTSIIDGQLKPYELIIRNGRNYVLTFNADRKEICIQFESQYQTNEKKVCEFIE